MNSKQTKSRPSKKNTEKLKALVRNLVKADVEVPAEAPDPVRSILMGIFSYDVPDERARHALDVLTRNFTDFNELRVATELEVQDMIGKGFPDLETRVNIMAGALQGIFENENLMSLDRLKAAGGQQVVEYLKRLPQMTDYVATFSSLVGFGQPGIPMDQTMLKWLVNQDAIQEDCTIADVREAVEHLVKADKHHHFLLAIRQSCFGAKKK